MKIAPTLVTTLTQYGIQYDTVRHRHADSSLNSAHAAHISTNLMAKPVILEDDQGFVMALVPANQHLKIQELNMFLNRDMHLASEHKISSLFKDCETGAIPPIGEAYGIETVVDYSFDDYPDVYFEAGNHKDLIHISGEDFRHLMESAHHASLCLH